MSRIRTAAALVGLAVSSFQPLAAQGTLRSANVRVVDAGSQRSVAGPSVVWESASQGLPRTSVRLDGNGRGVVSFPDGTGVLTITAPGFAPTRVKWPLGPSAEYEVRLERAAVLRVSVVSTEGSAVEATIAVLANRRTNPGAYSASTKGQPAEIGDLPPSEATLIVKGRGFAPHARRIELRAGERRDETIALKAASTITGRVVDGWGSPAADAQVSIQYDGRRPHAQALASMVGGRLRTASDGTFAVTGVVPGERVYVTASRQLARSRPMVLNLLEGATQSVTLTLQR